MDGISTATQQGAEREPGTAKSVLPSDDDQGLGQGMDKPPVSDGEMRGQDQATPTKPVESAVSQAKNAQEIAGGGLDRVAAADAANQPPKAPTQVDGLAAATDLEEQVGEEPAKREPAPTNTNFPSEANPSATEAPAVPGVISPDSTEPADVQINPEPAPETERTQEMIIREIRDRLDELEKQGKPKSSAASVEGGSQNAETI